MKKHLKPDGDFNQANKDFDALNLSDIKDIDTQYGKSRMGYLPNGVTVVVRPGSSNDKVSPSLDIQYSKNKITKIRYGLKTEEYK